MPCSLNTLCHLALAYALQSQYLSIPHAIWPYLTRALLFYPMPFCITSCLMVATSHAFVPYWALGKDTTAGKLERGSPRISLVPSVSLIC